MSEITCGRRSCRKEEERKAGGLMDEKGAYAKGIQVCAPPHISVTGHGWPAGWLWWEPHNLFWLGTRDPMISPGLNPKDSPRRSSMFTCWAWRLKRGATCWVLPGSGCPTSLSTHPKFTFLPGLPEFASELMDWFGDFEKTLIQEYLTWHLATKYIYASKKKNINLSLVRVPVWDAQTSKIHLHFPL